MERCQARLDLSLEGPKDWPRGSSFLRQRGGPREKETTWAPALTLTLSEPRGERPELLSSWTCPSSVGGRDQDAHTTEEDKPGAAAPASPGHGVSRCWCWEDGGMGEKGQGCFPGLFLQTFPGQEQPGGWGWRWGRGVRPVDGESPSGLLYLKAPGVRSRESRWVGKLGLSEPAPCRVQRSPGQRSSSWSQSACCSPPPFQQPASVIPEFCPPPSSKLFPISSPTPGSGSEMNVYPSFSSELACLRKSQCPLSLVFGKLHCTLWESWLQLESYFLQLG